MKNFKLVLSLTLLLTLIAVVRCSKSSDPAPLVGISGTVTYTDANGTVQKAAGAVVYLAKGTAATTTYDHSTIAGSDGTYSFPTLPAAGYYINAVYQSDNKNSSARIDGVKFTTANGFLVTLASTALTQDIALESTGSTGTAVNVTVAYQWDATAKTYTNTGAWTFDNIHSPVQFNFPYHGAEAEFAASFVQTKSFQMTFNSASLSTSSIVAIVDMASINTGTPGGRDNLPTTVTSTNEFTPGTLFTKLGCIMGTFGITADAGTVTPNITLSGDNRYATFTSTSIKAYGDGYVANGTLAFHGFTKSVSMIFHYLPSYVDTSVTPNKTYQGFEGKITIKALTDFGISSTSVGDLVTIYTTVNLYK